MPHTRTILLSILLVSLCISFGFSQTNEGQEFWFGFMEHRDVGQNSMVAMITSKENTAGTISIPALGWSREITVLANTVNLVNLPPTAEHRGSEAVNAKGILVSMEAPSSVYIHQYFGMRSEASVVLPVESLGSEYWVMAYSGIRQGNTDYPSEFLVVATEDSTVLHIELSAASKGRSLNRSPIEVLLNQGQSYQIQAADPNDDFTGSYVSANKNFALFAGTSWTQVPRFCEWRDNLLEQMYPVSTWGKSFVTVPFIHNPYDVIRIMASEDNTPISVESSEGVNNFVLNRGEFREFNQALPSFIQSDKPIAVAQYVIGTACSSHPIGDPSMVLLNSIEQSRQKLTFFNSSFQAIDENYVNITTQTEDTSFVLLDGNPLSYFRSFFEVLEANPKYAFTRVQVSPGSHTLESRRCGVSAIVYGYGDVESYAYNGGANFIKLNTELPPLDACLGDPFSIDLGLNEERYVFQWDFGDGIQSEEAVAQHTYENPGEYALSLNLTDECLDTQNAFESSVRVEEKEEIMALASQLLCQGDTLLLEVTGNPGISFAWSGPENFSADTCLVRLSNVQPAMSGTYSVIGQTETCATLPAQTEVSIIPTPQPFLGLDTFFCPPKGESLTLNPGLYTAYQWEDFSTQETKVVETAGEYIVEVWEENGCSGADTLLIDERCPAQLSMPNAFSPNGDQVNDLMTLTTEFVQKIKLQIFDRWGKLVHTSADLQANWDGKTPNGKEAQEGVYFWFLEWEGYDDLGEYAVHPMTGNVLLVR